MVLSAEALVSFFSAPSETGLTAFSSAFFFFLSFFSFPPSVASTATALPPSALSFLFFSVGLFASAASDSRARFCLTGSLSLISSNRLCKFVLSSRGEITTKIFAPYLVSLSSSSRSSGCISTSELTSRKSYASSSESNPPSESVGSLSEACPKKSCQDW